MTIPLTRAAKGHSMYDKEKMQHVGEKDRPQGQQNFFNKTRKMLILTYIALRENEENQSTNLVSNTGEDPSAAGTWACRCTLLFHGIN